MTAEQTRRSGNPAGAVDLCRDALARFPGHLSARVTLGWALLDLGRLQEAREEFQIVRQHAPDNFAAIRGLAQLHVLDENDPTYTPDLEETQEPSAAIVAVAPPAPHVPPVVMRLESWLSRVEALRAAV